MSTGMATLAEIDEAVRTAREAGARQIALLKCTSAYPAPPEEMNLRTIPHLAEAFRSRPASFRPHPGNCHTVAAVALGPVWWRSISLYPALFLDRIALSLWSPMNLKPWSMPSAWPKRQLGSISLRGNRSGGHEPGLPPLPVCGQGYGDR